MARKKSSVATAASGLSRAIRQCVDSGKVKFGSNEGLKTALFGSAKLIIVASNCPKDISSDALRFCKLSGIPSIVFDGTSMELGTVAGRPHPVAIMAVFDAGNSGILEFSK